MRRRTLGILIGLGYDIILVFSLIAINVELPWFVFFLLTSLLGTFYPALGFLVVDLKSLIAKSAFVGLFAVHLFVVTSFFLDGVFSAQLRDFRMLENPVSSSVMIAFASIPHLLFITYFIRYVVRNGFFDNGDEQAQLNILSR